LFFPKSPKAGTTPSYSVFIQQILKKYPDLIVLDVMDHDFDPKRFKLKSSGDCYPSEYGHSVIADTVRKGLQDVLEAKAAEIDASAVRN